MWICGRFRSKDRRYYNGRNQSEVFQRLYHCDRSQLSVQGIYETLPGLASTLLLGTEWVEACSGATHRISSANRR